MKTVLVIDDSSELRQILKKLIATIPGIKLIGEAEDSRTALMLHEQLMPDIIVLDIELNQESGIKVLSAVKKSLHQPITIIFSNYANSTLRNVTKTLGAEYFYDKSQEIEKLVETLYHLAAK